MYLQTRYIILTEAVVQLFEFFIYKEFPPIIQLPVHLKGQQSVYFRDNTTADQLVNAVERAKSYLITFFDYNQNYTDNREIFYIDFPATYVYKRELKTW